MTPSTSSAVASSTHTRGIHSAPEERSVTSRPSVSASHSGSAKRSSAAVAQRLQQDVGVRGHAAQAAGGEQQRAHVRGPLVGGERVQRVAGRDHVEVQDAGQRVVDRAARRARVSHSTSARKRSRREATSALEHLQQAGRLGLRAGQQPVGVDRAARHALARELEAQLAQRERDLVVAVLGLGRVLRRELADGVDLQQPQPVLEVGRLALEPRCVRGREKRAPARASRGRLGSTSRTHSANAASSRSCSVSAWKRASCSARYARSAATGSVSHTSSW